MEFKKWFEAKIGGEGDLPRMPWSGRIRRSVEIPAMKMQEPYRSLYPDLKDRPASSVDYEPTHRYKDPEMGGETIMVTQEFPTHVKFITSFGSTGGEPIDNFKKKFEPIPQSHLN